MSFRPIPENFLPKATKLSNLYEILISRFPSFEGTEQRFINEDTTLLMELEDTIKVLSRVDPKTLLRALDFVPGNDGTRILLQNRANGAIFLTEIKEQFQKLIQPHGLYNTTSESSGANGC